MLGIPTKIDAHLCIANSHNNHGQQIGQNEEDDIVPVKNLYSRQLISTVYRNIFISRYFTYT